MLGNKLAFQALREAARQTAPSRSVTFQNFATDALLANGNRLSAATAPVGTLSLARIRELAQLYKQLSKAKLSLLVVSTAAAGFVAGSGETVDWTKLWWTSVGTMASASSANALNQIYEVSNDSLMKRTARRPLPTGKLSVAHALAFAGITAAGGIGILASQVRTCTYNLSQYLAHPKCLSLLLTWHHQIYYSQIPCCFTDQQSDSWAWCCQYCPVCGSVHTPQGHQHLKHMGWSGGGCNTPSHGLGCSSGPARPGVLGVGKHAILLADAPFHGAGLDVSRRLCSRRLQDAFPG